MSHEQDLMRNLQHGIAKTEAEKFLAMLPALIEVQQAIADYQYARYAALVKAGFSEPQAMYLLINGGGS